MTHRILAVVLASVVACAGEPQSAPQQTTEADTVDLEDGPKAPPLPPMPEYPSPRRGRLVAVGAGRGGTQEGAWRGQAARCDDPPVVQLIAQDAQVGTILLFHLAPPVWWLDRYPTAMPDAGFPEPPAVQIGVQHTADRDVRAYTAVDGAAELEELNGRTSGRFAVTLVELESGDSLRYVGVFSDIPVGQQSPEDCATIAAALAPLDTAADSVEVNAGPSEEPRSRR